MVKEGLKILRPGKFKISIMSLLQKLAAAWTLLVFAATKRYARVPHFMTLALVISQVRVCVWMQRTFFYWIYLLFNRYK